MLEQNFFVEQVLPAGMNHTLAPAEWAPFRPCVSEGRSCAGFSRSRSSATRPLSTGPSVATRLQGIRPFHVLWILLVVFTSSL